MAQSAAKQAESLQYRLRNSLTLQGINTLADFSRRNQSGKQAKHSIINRCNHSTSHPYHFTEIMQYTQPFIRIMGMDPLGRLNKAMLKILSLQKQGPPELFEPLVTVILDEQPKSNEEMRKLTKENFTRPPTSFDVPSNPASTGIKSGTMNSLGQIYEFVSLLKRELSDLTYINVPGLLKKQSPNLQFPRAWQAFSIKPLKGTTDQHKRGGAIVSRGTKNGYIHIKDILVPFELKSNKAQAKQAYICLAKYVYKIFKHQPTQSFVVGLTLCRSSLKLWQFDRSGAIGSKLLELKANQKHLKMGTAFRRPKWTIKFAQTTYDSVVPNEFVNRVHRRLVLKDVGQPIWEADCPVCLLKALEDCIKGHQGLLKAGYLHCNILVNNLMIGNTHNPDQNFLIDLDAAIPYHPTEKQERQGKTGTKVFMSIYLLNNKKHLHHFVDELESFFWVLIWICIHYPEKEKKILEVTKWNYQPLATLAALK
ncbi:hypothetical protein PTTG_05626 [Puccinia triticina 1-1 BBBD Race 1]|uniref:Fungal-type protein kinase domain-containing protein n=1 Tax=Puccinia triticina (isolate 1-1 / race 1 (BBBD)) TaxID=630390 RepID=A0A180GBS0_PUCT1|nr:hypothetical protein PTTG_05626 [Puccinia triticina 1-1 BBBD Race 1]